MLMRESIEICRRFAHEMGINIWFRQGGYLFLVRSEDRAQALQSNVEIQNRCGLETRLLTAKEAQRIVPELDTSGIVAASFNAKDGVVFPWPLVWGYSEGAIRHGVQVQTFEEVVAIEAEKDRIVRVVTNRGKYPASLVINACGAHSPRIAKLLNVQLPTHPHRHEICATEPLKMFLGPLVSDLSNGLYFSQSMRGEIVGGISDARAPNDLDQGSSYRFLSLYSQALLRACPILGQVKVLRQWSGSYDLSPDQNPIVGEVDEVEGFYQASGFMGHGFMMAPVMGQRIAQHIASGKEEPLIAKWNLRRFREGRLLSEGMIIG
jgi:sarcosine oxidase subunit beta